MFKFKKWITKWNFRKWTNTNNRLKIKILNKYSNVTSQLFDETIDYLLSGRKIILCLEGYRISQVTVTDYLKNSDIDKDLIVLRKCQGESLEKIGQEKGLTRERIRQIINNRIKSLPIFMTKLNIMGCYLVINLQVTTLIY